MELRPRIRTVVPVASRASGVKFNPEKTLAQIQRMSDTSLIQLYRMTRSELKSRKEDFELAAHQAEKKRQLEADNERKGKLELQRMIELQREQRGHK